MYHLGEYHGLTALRLLLQYLSCRERKNCRFGRQKRIVDGHFQHHPTVVALEMLPKSVLAIVYVHVTYTHDATTRQRLLASVLASV